MIFVVFYKQRTKSEKLIIIINDNTKEYSHHHPIIFIIPDNSPGRLSPAGAVVKKHISHLVICVC